MQPETNSNQALGQPQQGQRRRAYVRDLNESECSVQGSVVLEGTWSKEERDEVTQYLIDVTKAELFRREMSYRGFRAAQAKLFAFPGPCLCQECKDKLCEDVLETDSEGENDPVRM